MPDKSSAASLHGTKGHEVLERIVRGQSYADLKPDKEMEILTKQAARYITHEAGKRKADLLIEARVSLEFIHPEAFGTLDYALVDHFGTLDIMDFKYGVHLVSPKENKQLIFYALGLAHKFNWNFARARLTIIQPRARGYDGPLIWETSILDLKSYVPHYRKVIERAETETTTYKEGNHCFFCKGKVRCPLKTKAKAESARAAFGLTK
jgi:hypothetical protein